MTGRQADELRAVAEELLATPVPETTAATTSLLALGADSVLAMRLRAQAATRLGLDLSLDDLLGPAPLAEVLASARPLPTDRADPTDPAAPADPARPAGARLPAHLGVDHSAVPADAGGERRVEQPTPGQRGMWLAEQAVGEPLYHLVFTALLDGPLDTAALVAAVERTVARHDGLRTAVDIADGELVRVVHDGFRPEIARVRSLGDNPFEERVRELAEAMARRPFDSAEPLLRLLLISGERDRHALVLVTHHVMLDAWAVGLALREILDRYAAATTGVRAELPPAPSPRALVAHHRALARDGELDRQLRWWRTRLDGVAPVLELPADRSRPARRTAGGVRLPFSLTPRQGRTVDAGARRAGVTPFALLLAAFALTVARHTGVRRMLVGVPTAGRPTAELQRLVAQCALVVPVVITVDDEEDTAGYLRGVQRSLLDSMANGDVPLEVLATRHAPAGEQARNPLVQLVCGRYDQLIDWQRRVGPLRVRVVEWHAGGSPMDVTVAFRQGSPDYGGTLEFATSLWREAEAAAFLDSYLAAAVELAAVEETGAPVGTVRAVPTADPACDPDPDTAVTVAAADTVHRRVLANAADHPDAVALRCGEQVVTYRMLAELATSHAAALRAAGARKGDLVAVGLPRSARLVAAVLGTWLVGATVLPFTPTDTPRTVARALRAARPATAVADELLARTLDGFGVPIATVPHAEDLPEEAVPPLAVVSEAPAFQRAGTGAHGPDGTVSHAALVSLADECRELGPGTRTVHWSPLWSDGAALELWLPLMSGGEVEILPTTGPVDPGELARFVATRDVTALWTTDSLASAMAAEEPGCLGGVRHLMGRAPLRAAGSAGALLACGSAVTAITLLVPPGRDRLPPATGRCRVLDTAGRALPNGAVGHLHVAGEHGEHPAGVLARISPAANTLQVLGPVEDLLDGAGCPVNAADVAAELRAHRDVADASVLVTDAWGERELLACYVARRPSLEPAVLGEWLANRVRAVPTRWVALPSMPLTPTGELDRQRVVTACRRAAGPARSVA